MIVQCLLSCIGQEYRPLEIDISDDSPNDDTEKAIRLVPIPKDITIRYRRNTPSLGEPENVNSLFSNARGNYCLLIHDDDVLLPGAVTTLVAALGWSAGAMASFGRHDVIHNSGEYSAEDTRRTNADFRREAINEGIISDPLISALSRQFPNNGYLIKTDIARSVPYRSRLEIGGAGDTDFAIRIAQRFPERCFIFVAQAVSQYRVTYGSASSTMTDKVLKLYDYVLALRTSTPMQEAARVDLLRNLAHQAVSNQAIQGSRWRSLKILFSSHYEAKGRRSRFFYHLALIAVPRLHRVKRFLNHE